MTHPVLGQPVELPAADGLQEAVFGMGCFWGAERKFWQTPGVVTTSVGYAGGRRPDPSYEQVCSGATGHVEVVRVVFDPAHVSYADLLRVFWENHDPTQGNRQGNDRGTQYRSVIFTYGDEQHAEALASLQRFQEQLRAAGYGPITTTVEHAPPYYLAEAYHQQYLHKNPNGYCGLGGTGVRCA